MVMKDELRKMKKVLKLMEHVDGQGVIQLKGAAFNGPREPDGVAWISTGSLVTADEGDLDGGSRGFTIFSTPDSANCTKSSLTYHRWIRGVGKDPSFFLIKMQRCSGTMIVISSSVL